MKIKLGGGHSAPPQNSSPFSPLATLQWVKAWLPEGSYENADSQSAELRL
jgi:hypothetical protein